MSTTVVGGVVGLVDEVDVGDGAVQDLGDLVGQWETGVVTHSAVEDVFQRRPVGRVEVRLQKRQLRRRLEVGHGDRRGGDGVAELAELRRLVDGVLGTLRGRRRSTVDEAELLVGLRVHRVANVAPVGHPEALARLQVGLDSGRDLGQAETLVESLRVVEALDGRSEDLGRVEVGVEDVVRVLRVCLCARRLLRDGDEAVPGVPYVVDVENAPVDALSELAVLRCAPGECGHD